MLVRRRTMQNASPDVAAVMNPDLGSVCLHYSSLVWEREKFFCTFSIKDSIHETHSSAVYLSISAVQL